MSQARWLNDLRAIGVKSATLRDDGTILMVEFFPATEKLDTSPSMPRHLDLGAPAMCACSHDETAHNAEGLCLMGCAESSCFQPKSDAQKVPDAS